jgi:hypothetical protein
MRFAALLLAAAACAQDFPSAEIRNSAITAKFYLPDAQRGYYRGTRFDWSGVIYSLRTANHEYFGKWFPKYDPNLHDAIMGPVEEYRTNNAGLGYDEAKPGGTFIRIGVGVVRKPDEPQYQGFKTYEIVDHGKWKVRAKKDRITFTHELSDGAGYAYRYTKTVRLVNNQPLMRIEHTLKNTGRKAIESSQYNHNFFVIDGQPVGPDTTVTLPFELRANRPFGPEPGKAAGREIGYTREVRDGDRVFAEFAGGDYDIRVRNRKTGAAVHITGDLPIAKLVYWSIRTVFSPEPYVDLAIAPGAQKTWTYTYRFE